MLLGHGGGLSLHSLIQSFASPRIAIWQALLEQQFRIAALVAHFKLPIGERVHGYYS
jgi:hypothetical protein